MNRWLLKPAVQLLAFAVGLGLAALQHALWQHRSMVAQIHQESHAIQASLNNELTDDSEMIVEGRYSNFDYAYSVLIPKGMAAAMNSTPPNPNHGFGIDVVNPTSISWLSKREVPESILWADASYDSAETGSPNQEIKESVKWLREKHNQVRLISRIPTRLGSLRAVRFIIGYEESGQPMIEDRIVAFRSQLGEGSDIVYSLKLKTLSSRYNQDKSMLSQIQRSWIIDPLPNDYPLPTVYEASHP